MKTVTEYRQEIDNLMQGLADARTRCVQENREPSVEERRIAKDVLARVAELEEVITLELATQETHERLNASQRAPIKPMLSNGSEPSQEKKDAFKSFGEQLVAVIRAGADRPVIDPRLRTTIYDAATGLQESLPSEGGFLVQQDFSSQLLEKAYETGQVSSRAWRMPLGPNSNGMKMPGVDETSRAEGSRWGGIRLYWEGEGDEKTASKPKFRMIELNLKKLIGLCYATDELLQDAVALEAFIRRAFTSEFAFKMDDVFIWGTGAGQPLGIMNGPCLVTVSKEAGQLAKTIVVENIVNMWARMLAASRPNAVWFINQDIEPQLFTMGLTVGTGGSPVYMPAGGISQAPYGTLFGRPVIPIEQCQTLGTKGDIILADFGEYLTIDKGGLQAASSIHVRFIYDETAFRFVYRVDGQPTWNAARTPAKGSNALSPFVVLESRA